MTSPIPNMCYWKRDGQIVCAVHAAKTVESEWGPSISLSNFPKKEKKNVTPETVCIGHVQMECAMI